MIRFLICSLCLAAGLCSFTLFAQTTPDLTPLDEIADRAAFEMQTDLDLVVLHRGEVVYRKQTTGHGGVGAIGIASASKWLAAATMQSMVEDGLLSWDDPAGLYLYYFRDDKAGITLRDLFSHTSGMASSFACLQERSKTIDECVQTIAGQPLLYPPGTAFHYGDASFQVGARAAETVTARFWEDLFQRRIAQPLGMRFTTFQPDGATFNPDVAAGAFSVADDYLRFLEMLVAGGEWEGRRILSRRSLDLMFADQTRGTRIASSFYAADEGIRPGAVRNRYGLGNWLEGAVDGVSEGNSSPGAFGVSPYIDRERDFAFLAFLRDPALGFNRFYYEIKDVLNEAFQVPPVSITSEIVERFVVAGSIPEGGPSQRAGGLRRARRYVPAACREETSQCPAVIAMHPDASNGPAFATAAGLVAFAERERVVVELWDGLPAISSGNAATEGEPLYWDLMPDFGAEQGNDARLAVWASQDLAGTVGVDPQRIYLLGFQAGADAAALAACRDPHAFAGMVLVAPTFTLKSAGGDEGEDRVCDSTGRLPVMLWGGLPEAAEADKGDGSVVQLQAAFWAQRHRCLARGSSEWPDGGEALSVTEWSGCDSSAYVRLVESDGPLEEWPAKGMPLAWEFLRGLDSGMRGRASVTASNAASYTRRHTAPGALASLFGESMSPATESAAGPGLPGTLAGVRVELRDRTGNTGNAGMVFVSPGQINVQIPDGLQTGMASMFVYQGQSLTHRDWLYVDASAPGLFANDATGAGPPAGEVLYIRPDGSRVSGPLATAIPLTVGSSGFVSAPVQLGEPGTEVYVILYGTGWASAEAGSVKAMLGGETLLPEYAGRQGGFTGLDQLNLRLDTLPEETIARLAGRVNPVSVCYGDVCSNRLQLLIEKALPAGQ